MKTSKRILRAFTVSLFFIIQTLSGAVGAAQADASADGYTGKQWRFIYHEGGAYGEYDNHLRSIISGLMRLGWAEQQDVPEQLNSRELWLWAAQNVVSDKIEFVADGFYSAGWDEQSRDAVRQEIMQRLNQQQDVDLVIAMGTWAGLDLATNEHNVPIFVVSSTDPVRAGIIAGINQSGFDHVYAHIDPEFHQRKLRLFHEFVGFKTLGVAYENTVEGRSYAGVEQIEGLADELNYEVVSCNTVSDSSDQSAADNSVIDCFKDLVQRVDAIYISDQGGVNEATIPQLANLANEQRVPTLSGLNLDAVKLGFLLSFSHMESQGIGDFIAGQMARVIKGAQAGSLNQVYQETPSIAINLETAEQIGLYLHADLLAAADVIYRQTEAP